MGICKCPVRVDGAESIGYRVKAWHTRSQHRLKMVSMFQSGGENLVNQKASRMYRR